MKEGASPSIPKEVLIAARPYTISVTNRGKDGDWDGLCENDKLNLDIKQGLHPIDERDTVLHETLHAIIHTYCIPFKSPQAEEAVVRPLATALLAALLDNPKFTLWLTNPPKSKSQS